jgi:hypothetical protein
VLPTISLILVGLYFSTCKETKREKYKKKLGQRVEQDGWRKLDHSSIQILGDWDVPMGAQMYF